MIADFLAANPGEVVIAFIEPYVPVDTIGRALDGAGLLDAGRHAPRSAGRFPRWAGWSGTDTRLVVLAEEDGGTRPWYLPGFSFVQDTPLGRPRRASSAAPLTAAVPTAPCCW